MQTTLGRNSSALLTPGRLTSTPVTQQSPRPTAQVMATATATSQPEVHLAAQPSASSATRPTSEQAAEPTVHSEVPSVAPAQAQAASSQVSASSIKGPTALSVDKKVGGSEKLWVCPEGSSVGWLQPHASTDSAVMTRESDTIKKLAALGFPVAKIIDGPPPTSISTGSGNVPVASSGFWMEKVDSVANGKPKRLGGPFGGDELAQKLVNELKAGDVDLGALRANLKSLHGKAEDLCEHVGELDLYVGKDGQVKLLDVAPDHTERVLGDDPVAVGQVKKGLERMMAAIDKLEPAPAAGAAGSATAGRADRVATRG
ncbi:hypothetical protein [Roseateles sp. YR242]|uniref:hypothetical protein n=1 Tax=Roseateles sp. YR242 TaxID=1855305 RepID=UPI00116022E6|nr:hypothetical protein [Roseateles sp. YR242]